MGQSITDSNVDKNDLHFLSGKEDNIGLHPANIETGSRKNMSVNDCVSADALRDSVSS